MTHSWKLSSQSQLHFLKLCFVTVQSATGALWVHDIFRVTWTLMDVLHDTWHVSTPVHDVMHHTRHDIADEYYFSGEKVGVNWLRVYLISWYVYTLKLKSTYIIFLNNSSVVKSCHWRSKLENILKRKLWHIRRDMSCYTSSGTEEHDILEIWAEDNEC